jgi:hypothetical protein
VKVPESYLSFLNEEHGVEPSTGLFVGERPFFELVALPVTLGSPVRLLVVQNGDVKLFDPGSVFQRRRPPLVTAGSGDVQVRSCRVGRGTVVRFSTFKSVVLRGVDPATITQML